MPGSTFRNLPDRVGRFLQLADDWKSSPFYTKAVLKYDQFLTLGATAGACGLWLDLLMCRGAYVGVQRRLDDIAAALSCDQAGVIPGTGQGLIPNVAFYGQSSGLNVTIAFAGTDQVKQWLSYLAFQGQVQTPNVEGRVFEALATIAAQTWAPVETFLRGWNDDCNVRMVGHSLGGALAEILGRVFKATRSQKMRGVTTFASPRVGDRDFANVSNIWIDRVVLEGDPIPDLPPPVYTRQAVDNALGRFAQVVPITYRHSNCTRYQISVQHYPERSEAGPRYEHVVPLSEMGFALNLDGLSAAHGTSAYESALWPWMPARVKETTWFAAAAAASADMKMVTGY